MNPERIGHPKAVMREAGGDFKLFARVPEGVHGGDFMLYIIVSGDTKHPRESKLFQRRENVEKQCPHSFGAYVERAGKASRRLIDTPIERYTYLFM